MKMDSGIQHRVIRAVACLLLTSVVVTMAFADRAGGRHGKMSSLVREAATRVSSPEFAHLSRANIHTPLINAFVRANPEAADQVFAANGCTVYDRNGDIFIVGIPINRLNDVCSSDHISRIEASAPCTLSMDTTSILVGALPVYAGQSLPQAYTGRGVVVGVMDVGFDLTHPNFYDPATGEYRVMALWDMLDRDTLVSGFPVGRDYIGREALLDKRHSTDGLIMTHGTHTLGIAAGGGYGSKYRGMAYESDICLVNNAVSEDIELIDPADIYKYTSAVDALGFKYLFDYADSRGMPCVASFSEGYYAGMGQEDSLYSEYIDRISGPGHIIVASAGNESVKYGFVSKPVGVASAGAFILSGYDTAAFCAQSDAPFCFSIISYGTPADTLTVSSADCPADSTVCFPFQLSGSGHSCTVSVERYPSSFSSKDSAYYIEIKCDVQLYALPPLALVLMGEQAEASVRSVSSAGFTNGGADPRWSSAEISHNIHAPACFKGVIAVGSTIHRTGFTNYLGQYFDYSQAGRNDGTRSYYSSVGPTMDGRVKPDVMAPGDNVVSSYSSFYLEHNPDARDIQSDVAHFDFDGRTYAWNSNTGTSMATPVVAGAIALWLQAKPDLTPAEAMDIISHTCRHPEPELTYPNNNYGHGEINAYAGLLRILGIDGIEGLDHDMPHGVRMAYNGADGLTLRFDREVAGTLRLTVYSLSGAIVHTTTVDPCGRKEVSVALPRLRGGVYAVQIAGTDKSLTGSSLIRVD